MDSTSHHQEQAARARLIGAVGWLILLLAAGAAILPLISRAHGAATIGAMMTLAGAAEVVAGTRRYETRKLAMLAGALTIVAGLMFLLTDHAVKFLPSLVIIAGWLFLRSLVLGAACFLEHGSVRRWTGIAAATDFILGLITAIGLSISSLVVTLFGASPPLVASFAWILAISFIATSMLLLEVAACARKEDV